ncbi:hypothetical protein [Pseudomonas kurunegalensis]|uniref:hypothetical protein n=1 Tax=Pseudomonas kurunegalensis TaxID=485880 RepID=UPI0025708AE5|nr:hypothetical protein [Pseudomonas kurunegalensis]WJD60727.1 hypothetical protein QQ992_17485 [Pseudomonas kurunegalensis]
MLRFGKLPLSGKHIAIVAVIVGLYAGFVAWFVWPETSISRARVCEVGGCADEVFLVHGKVNELGAWRVKKNLEELIAAHPEIKKVCVSSRGGVSESAMEIADTIFSNGLQTCLALKYRLEGTAGGYIEGECQSACIWMVLAGKERILYDDRLLLGFHAARYRSGGIAVADLPMYIDRLTRYVGARKGGFEEVEPLTSLSWWAFQQGAEVETTNCTAREVQKLYPYFTTVRLVSNAPYKHCGIVPPGKVKRAL